MNEDIKPERKNKKVKFLVCVDEAEQSKVALRVACLKAKKVGGLVDMLHVIEPADFQGLFSVAEKMSIDKREEAEKLLQGFASEAQDWAGIIPTLLVREGGVKEQIFEAIKEDPSISMLVVGVAPKSKMNRELLNSLADQLGEKLMIPIMAVPGNLTYQQIEDLC